MTTAIGERLRDVRKRRGMSQRELAEQSGVSLSLIRKLEQGKRSDTRLETAHRLAAALRVPTTGLLTSSPEEGADASTVDLWEPVRRALVAPVGAGNDLEEPTYAGVSQSLRNAMPLFSGDRFAELGAILPALLRDSEVVAEHGPEGQAVRARLLNLTGWLLTQTRQFDAAELALERALDSAVDRLQGAATINTMCWLLLRRGQLTQSRELATKWAEELEPRFSKATSDELSAWGWLLLRVSTASARDNRPGEAAASMRLAKAAAAGVGREFRLREDFLRTFGPGTVALKSAENSIITGDPNPVLRLAAEAPVTSIKTTSSNLNRHRLDLASAYTQTRCYGDAVGVLQEIAHSSPQWLPNQRYARDILGEIVNKRRTLTPEMRSLADVVGLPL
ncbi:helix-turn-helix domain-containing protein [Streptomyces sp. NPDC005955]|uniref:helix-turn-helix domain-containing protein n=1 Tax=Streptomyces sp. NPDC005955 TaxID=3364738 RepID=UPI0036A33238